MRVEIGAGNDNAGGWDEVEGDNYDDENNDEEWHSREMKGEIGRMVTSPEIGTRIIYSDDVCDHNQPLTHNRLSFRVR